MIINVKQGSLKGGVSKSVLTGKEYYYFTGVPYAEPPVGDLRFQPPVPKKAWEGVRDASACDDNECIQKCRETGSTKGSEDCLYLNIYTPELPSSKGTLKPVMVYIHGGAFSTGSGGVSNKGPDYLINHDIVLVTLNYRLHVLGFLNLNIPSCRGNCGLKDQALALIWIKENIKAFGGDPENITIFGESAGSTSVHYQMMSPLTKGIVKRGIVQSGGAFVGWAIQGEPEKQAFKLGELLGFKGNDPEELVTFLKTQKLEDLCLGASNVMKLIKAENPWLCNFLAFGPSVEKIKENAFLPDRPENLVLEMDDHLPLITGVTQKEGVVAVMDMIPDFLQKVDDNMDSVIKYNIRCKPEHVKPLAEEVKKFYFGNITEKEKLAQFVNLYSDLYFLNMYSSVEYLIKAKQPVYFFQFTFNGMLNSASPNTGPGPSHAEDVLYLFHNKLKYPSPIFGEAEKNVITNFCALWANFAKTGNPTPDPKQFGVTWKQYDVENPYYLEINNEVKLVNGYIWTQRREFWTKVLKSIEQN